MTTGPALVATLGTLTLAISSLAQHTTPQTQSPRPPATVTIEGCVQDAVQPTAPPDRRAENDAAPRRAEDLATGNVEAPPPFVLSNARRIAPAAPVGTGGLATTRHADGTVVQEDPRHTPKTFGLIGPSDVLSRFTGRRVEVDGTPAPPLRERDDHERLTVVRLRQVAGDCTATNSQVR